MATRGFTSGGGVGSATNTQRNTLGTSQPRSNPAPVTQVGSQGGSSTYRTPISAAPYVISTYRSGDYIYTQYSNGKYDKTYSPQNKVSTATGAFSGGTTGTGGAKANSVKGGGSSGGGGFSPGSSAGGQGGYMATPTGSSGQNSTGGGGSSNVGGGSATGGMNDSDVGKLFGWTEGMTETDVIRGLEYPMRILQQITGKDLSQNPAFGGFMSPIVSAASNPNTQLLFNPQLGGSNTTTGSEGYNFIADLIKGYMTPGGALPDVGTALSRIASALGNNQSGIYNLLMQGANGQGAAQGQSGMGAYGAMFDALSGMIDPILSLGASPLQSMMTQASMNNLMNNFMMNVNDNSENPLAYLLRGLGYNTNIAGMPSIQGGSGGGNPAGAGSAFGGM